MITVTLEPLTMEEASSFWKDKVHLSPGEFAKLSAEAKVKAFSISGIAKGDELTSVYNSLQRAINEGISFSKFKAECAEIFSSRGWTGKRDWRVQNIFRTNIQTAYNSGRWKKQKELAESFPYLQYSAVNDRRTRPTHRAMDGRVYPIDHPVWDTWYPPNGYRCRCSTFSLTEGQVEREGLTVEIDDPTDKPIALPDLITGEKVNVQQLLPDPGFNHHPGKVVWGGLAKQRKKTIKPDSDMCRSAGDICFAGYQPPSLNEVRPDQIGELDEGNLLPAGKDDAFYRAEFKKLYGEEMVFTDAGGDPVVVSLQALSFNQTGDGEAIHLLKDALENPFEVWVMMQKVAPPNRLGVVKRYITFWKTNDQKRVGGVAIFEVVDCVYQGVTAFIPFKEDTVDLKQVERQRTGLLLFPQ